MRALRTVPAVVAALLLGAHFLRAGGGASVLAAILVAVAAPVADRRVRLAVRLALAAGAIEWLWTAWSIARVRVATGQDYVRMLAILGTVAAFTAFAAWWLPAIPRRSESASASDRNRPL